MSRETGEKGLVTVGLMAYNRAGTYLTAAIDSILAQTYKNFELIISDNASPDNTEEICREYAKRDPRVRYIRQKENIGYTANVNFVNGEARGEYFFWFCDDDVLAPTFIEKCVARLETHPESIMAAVRPVSFDDTGRYEQPRESKKMCPWEKDTYRRLKQFILLYESDGKPLVHFCAVWRRKAIADFVFINYFIRWPYNWDFQDMTLAFYGLIRGSFECVDEVLYYKRARPTSFDFKKKFFPRRIFDSFVHSRLRRLTTPFFYTRMRMITGIKELSLFARAKLMFWNLFAMSRLFWRKKI